MGALCSTDTAEKDDDDENYRGLSGQQVDGNEYQSQSIGLNGGDNEGHLYMNNDNVYERIIETAQRKFLSTASSLRHGGSGNVDVEADPLRYHFDAFERYTIRISSMTVMFITF